MKSTFWNLLKNKGIVVPIIQRDYAQGRSGERYQHIRENFLKQIGAVLGIFNINGDATLSGNLDFVYGMEEVNPINNEPSVYPIDGQQRLTTLWLVHWYLAFLTRNLEKKEIADILRRFSYETRTSSREFCNEICGLKYAEEGTRDIVAYIKQQTWFMSSWEQDPTIKAMLNMLRGENENSIDGIEKLFCNCAIESAWCYLTGSECALQFHYLPMNTHDNGLESFDLSDDLYIKMNARGKALTNFENFKADFVGWMQKNMPGQWVEIAANIDNAWTDLFWKNNKNGCIDEIFFAFINRFVFNNFLCQKKDENNWKYAETDVKKLDIWNLYGYEGDDSNVSYNDFSLYNNDKYCSITPEMVDRLNKTLVSLNNSAISKITSVLPEWAQDEELFFIPTYYIEEEGNIITILDRNQRVLFYAICVYLEQTEAPSLEDESFKQWMRVVCNITENNQTGLTDKLHLINDLSKGCQDILSYLSKNPESVIEGHKGNAQLQEEIDKAKQILSNPNKPQDWDEDTLGKWESWQAAIIKAESYKTQIGGKDKPFLKGAIRFLYYSSDPKKPQDWSLFARKFKQLDSLFRNDGSLAAAMQKFIDYVPLEFWCSNYNFDYKSLVQWKRIFTDSNYQNPVHNYLTLTNVDTDTTGIKGIIKGLIETKNYDQQKGSYWLLNDWKGYDYVYTCYSKRISEPNNDLCVFLNNNSAQTTD
ncbi:MAG: DUF262 domain-containing protein [Bacteroidales bacterium]|nr:DUF262 domain-containing protein [Bacteroidales bacterium]